MNTASEPTGAHPTDTGSAAVGPATPGGDSEQQTSATGGHESAAPQPSQGPSPVTDTGETEGSSAPRQPEYMQLNPTPQGGGHRSLERFFDVEVNITAELGQVSMPIGDIVKLSEGSVIDLDRPVNSPVDVVAQGVRIATGEVVIIDDCFAVRILSIESALDDEPESS